ncbi:hypothetical protein COH93_00535 [Neisseria meningitidis]|nr:hypothetical protein COH93_00535 [Neisseria meningitidis]
MTVASGEVSTFPPIFYISRGRGKFLPFCLHEGGVVAFFATTAGQQCRFWLTVARRKQINRVQR